MKTVLFDIDGTLLNTHEFIVSAYEHALERIGQPITREKAEAYFGVGKNLRATYAHMLPHEDTELLARLHHEYQMDKFHLITPFDDAESVLRTLKDAGYALGAVTNRSRASVIPSLSQHGLLGLFDTCICTEDTLRTKPDPEHIYTALRTLERAPENAWMVGDTHVDIEAARSAAIPSIGISHSGNNSLLAHSPDHMVYRLKDVLPIIFS